MIFHLDANKAKTEAADSKALRIGAESDGQAESDSPYGVQVLGIFRERVLETR